MGLLERRRLLLLQNATNSALSRKSTVSTKTESKVLEVGDQTIFNPTEEQLRAVGNESEK